MPRKLNYFLFEFFIWDFQARNMRTFFRIRFSTNGNLYVSWKIQNSKRCNVYFKIGSLKRDFRSVYIQNNKNSSKPNEIKKKYFRFTFLFQISLLNLINKINKFNNDFCIRDMTAIFGKNWYSRTISQVHNYNRKHIALAENCEQ